MNQPSAAHRLHELNNLFPEFAAYWASEGNCNRNDDGSFSLSGVWAEFSTFFEQHESVPSHAQLKELAELVNNCLASSIDEERGCVAACFLENIAGSYRANSLNAHLSETGQSMLKRWAPSC